MYDMTIMLFHFLLQDIDSAQSDCSCLTRFLWASRWARVAWEGFNV